MTSDFSKILRITFAVFVDYIILGLKSEIASFVTFLHELQQNKLPQ